MKAPGAMISFEIDGGLAAAVSFMQKLEIFACAESSAASSRSPITPRS